MDLHKILYEEYGEKIADALEKRPMYRNYTRLIEETEAMLYGAITNDYRDLLVSWSSMLEERQTIMEEEIFRLGFFAGISHERKQKLKP